jgi:hypothetical protein
VQGFVLVKPTAAEACRRFLDARPLDLVTQSSLTDSREAVPSA